MNRARLTFVRTLLIILALGGLAPSVAAESAVAEEDGRFVLKVDGAPVFVRGVSWRPPRSFEGNPAAFWQQPQADIDAVFDREAPLLKKGGINTLRYNSPPPKAWVDRLHERHGLFSVLTIHASTPAEQVKATVAPYEDSEGLLFWVVTGKPADDSLTKAIKEADAKHAVGLFSPKLADLTKPGAPLAGVDFIAIPSLAGVHQDGYERARSHLSRPLLLWTLDGDDPVQQWHAVNAHAVGSGSKGVALGAFTPRWCVDGEDAGALCRRTTDDDGSAVVVAGPGLAQLGKIHGVDPTTADADAIDAHFAGLVPPKPEPAAAPVPSPDPDPVDMPARPKNERIVKPKGTPNQVKVHKGPKGMKLVVDGRDFMVYGMNWGYIPIGANYGYDLWSKSDGFIKKALADEMPLLKKMGVNAIRQYDNIPPRWVTYIYETYGIYTMVNHLAGRYGFIVDGAFRPSTDYSDKATREAIKKSVAESAARFEDVPGVLLFLLGNENNYGLSWTGSDTEDLPDDADLDEARASHLYSLFGELVDIVHGIDKHHPVAICNGDVQYIKVASKYLKGKLDIFGTNVYRGNSVRDLFKVVKDNLDIPVVFTEFGADAYNAKDDREDHLAQAGYLKHQWKEIYEQSYGHGRVGNSIGGFVFQWSDGWWKYKQEVNLDVHDTNASWSTGAYPHDHVEGANNMNEEWFGIVAKGKPSDSGHFPVYPRAAYYVLRDIFELDPYDPSTTQAVIDAHFEEIEPYDYDQEYTRAYAGERARILDRVRLYDVGMKFETFTTGGRKLQDATEGEDLRFDHLQSFFIGAEVQPVRRFTGRVSFNIAGNIPENPINEIFYEKRGARRELADETGQDIDLSGLERVAVYRASFEWDESWFSAEGYYRTGHYHWMDEGDFFNLYREANYGPWLDVYNGQAPFGMAFEGKRALEGLRVAFGPQLYWGANPAVIAMYSRDVGDFKLTAAHQEDITVQGTTNTSGFVPEPKSRKSTASARFTHGAYKVEAGGIIAGTNRLERQFTGVREGTGVTYANSGFHLYEDEVRMVDTLGGKVRFQADWAPVTFYAQGGYKGLVADSGPDQMPNPGGWLLREAGRGNHYHALSGLLVRISDFSIAPNFLYQRPLEGPLPPIDDFLASGTGRYYPGVVARDVRSSPFVVLENRETVGMELVLGYDSTPGTWMWQWDNDRREDAPFATSLNFTYLIQPTSRDSSIGFTEDGAPIVFGAAPPGDNLLNVTSRSLFSLPGDVRMKVTMYGGQAQGNGGGTEVLDRTIVRGGGDLRLTWEQLAVEGGVKLNDFGPYDYHRDFNITFPVQVLADTSYAVNSQAWLVDFYSRFGLRYMMRTLDEFSVPMTLDPGAGYVWEVRTYMHVGVM